MADDLNEKLAKRPGPLELVESGILVSSNRSLTEAIKDGKIVYPKTSMVNLNHTRPYFSMPSDDSLLNSINFNLYLNDNDESNGSQISQLSASTNQTNSSSLTSFNSASFSFNGSQQQQQQQQYQQTNAFDADNMYQFESSPTASSTHSSATATLQANNNSKYSSSSPSPSNWDPVVPSGPKSKPSVLTGSQSKGKQTSSSSSTSSSSTVKAAKSASQKLVIHHYNGPNTSPVKTYLTIDNNSKSSRGLLKKTSSLGLKLSSKTSKAFNEPRHNTNGHVASNDNMMSVHRGSGSSNNNSSSVTSSSAVNTIDTFDDSNDSNSSSVCPLDVPLKTSYEVALEQNLLILLFDEKQNDDGTTKEPTAQFQQQQLESSESAKSNQSVEQTTFGGQMMTDSESAGRDDLSNHILDFLENFDEIISSEMTTNKQSNEGLLNLNDHQCNQLQADPAPTNNGDAILLNDLQPAQQQDYQQAMLGSSHSNTPSPAMNNNHNALNSSFDNVALNAIIMESNSLKKSISADLISSSSCSPPINNKPINNKPNLSNSKVIYDKMNVSELKEECKRRKLPATGTKQTLIDRLKKNSIAMFQLQNGNSSSGHQPMHFVASVKPLNSPDSGVNMDGSPSLMSITSMLSLFLVLF